MSEELGKAERDLVDRTIRDLMRELGKIGNPKVRYIGHQGPVAKDGDIIKVTVSIAATEFTTQVKGKDVWFDWPRVKDSLRT